MPLIEQVRRTIRRHDLVRPGMRVLIALSGGPDSVALTHLCLQLQQAGAFELAGVAHLNHRLRPEADEDAAFCAELAARLGLPFEAGVADVPADAAGRGVSLETAAHDARYRFLREVAHRLRADRVALGHTLDDQAETVLMRLLRGAGSRGLAGMYPRHGTFIRPLIEVRRADLQAFLRAAGILFREDASNQDRTIPRNRIRHELLPLLERDYNPGLVRLLGQQAELARAEWDWLNESAAKLCAAVVTGHLPEMHIAVEPIQAAPPALARAYVRQLLEQGAVGRPITWAHVMRALEFFAPGAVGMADFPGQRLERCGTHVVLTSRPAHRQRTTDTVESAVGFRYAMAIPGETPIPEASATLVAEMAEKMGGVVFDDFGSGQAGDASGRAMSGAGAVALVRLDRLAGERWAVRSRQPGDRLTWPGLGGRKKVHDIFVDGKVPRPQRDRVPIVVDAHDRVVWVAGHALAGEFRVTDPAQAVVVLRLKLWGGSA